MIIIRLILESFRFALNSLVVNKLRTILSLLGITIGIFCIISVFSVIDSFEKQIRGSMEKLGSNVIYLQKWPWTPPPGENEYPWWKYLSRPVVKLTEKSEIMRRSQLAEEVVYTFGFQRTVQVGSNKAENVTIIGGSSGMMEVWALDMQSGRSLSREELDGIHPFAVIGSELANQLFPDLDPVGRTLKIQGSKFTIIGVFMKMGSDMFGTSMDNRVMIPVQVASRMVDTRMDMGQSIIVKGRPEITAMQLSDELEGVMRSIRRLSPGEENNFAVNEVSLISKQLDIVSGVVNIAGWIIGGFAILVGGFGIANIMFVSVKERTKIIGIQKALGAKSKFIMLEYLFESVVLSLMGGAAGLLIIYAGTFAVKEAFDFVLVLSMGNVVTGLLISVVIGMIAGLIPARTAARLDPVTAINSI